MTKDEMSYIHNLYHKVMLDILDYERMVGGNDNAYNACKKQTMDRFGEAKRQLESHFKIFIDMIDDKKRS